MQRAYARDTIAVGGARWRNGVPQPVFCVRITAGQVLIDNNRIVKIRPDKLNPQDAAALDLVDGQPVKVTTKAGSLAAKLELSASIRRGVVVMPHGFGLDYAGQTVGANVNRLTQNTHRDPLAGTLLHRYIPCRVDRVPLRDAEGIQQ